MNDTATAADSIVAGCLEAIARCENIAAALTPEQYCAKWNEHQGVGPHMRHCVDHFLSLKRDLASGIINYDRRDRNPAIEQDPDVLVSVFHNIRLWLTGLAATNLQRKLRILQIPTVDTEAVEVESSLDRELLFLASHTIHHITIMNLVAEGNGITLPEELGMAYSTQAYLKLQECKA